MMTQKTISLPEDVYELLKKHKGEHETFSEAIVRLLEEVDGQKPQPDISMYYGKLDESDKGEWDRIEADIYNDRKRPSTRPNLTLDD